MHYTYGMLIVPCPPGLCPTSLGELILIAHNNLGSYTPYSKLTVLWTGILECMMFFKNSFLIVTPSCTEG